MQNCTFLLYSTVLGRRRVENRGGGLNYTCFVSLFLLPGHDLRAELLRINLLIPVASVLAPDGICHICWGIFNSEPFMEIVCSS